MPTGSVAAGGELALSDGSSVRVSVRERDAGGDWACILASDPTGRVVGRAAYARLYGPRAELTLDVADDYWDRGLGETLLARVRAGAAEQGIATLLARVRPSDVRLLALLRRAGASGETTRGGRVDVELPASPRAAVSPRAG